MRKTLKQLCYEQSYLTEQNLEDESERVVDYESVLKLLELCRLNTIQECANNALADYNTLDCEFTPSIEVYVLKESILQLDKNSIEIYEK